MNKSIIPSIIGVIVVISWVTGFFGGSGAVKYNNQLINECEKVEKKFSVLLDAAGEADSGEIMGLLTDCQVQITSSADKVSEMKDYKGNTEFRDAVLDLLEFYEDFSQGDLRELVQILSKSKDDIDAYDETRGNEIIDRFIAGEDHAFGELDKIQKVFAKEHKFTLKK